MSIFGHHIARGTVVLTIVEAMIFGSVFLISGYFLLGGERGQTIIVFVGDVVLPTGFVMICLLVAGGYKLEAWKSSRTMARRFACGAIGGSATIILFHDIMTGAGNVSYNLVLAALIGCAIACFWRWISGRSRHVLDYIERRVLILGAGQQAATLWTLLNPERSHGVNIVGFLRYHETEETARPPDRRIPVERIAETGQPLVDYATAARVDEIIVAFDSAEQRLPERELLDCRLRGIAVNDSISFIERETGRIGIDETNMRWLVFSPGFRRGRWRASAKRASDIVISSILLALLWPAMLVTAIMIRRDSPGPVLFRQTRVGLGGKPFTMYKFRSMRQDAEADGKARWAATNDDRITKVGRFLRLTRLDELPQLYNVLRGDMSLVGPRPERPEFVEGLAREIAFYNERHSVRPGITGWAQTSFAYAATVEDTKTKLEYDLYYVKNHSLFLDLLVLIQTFKVAMKGDGAR